MKKLKSIICLVLCMSMAFQVFPTLMAFADENIEVQTEAEEEIETITVSTPEQLEQLANNIDNEQVIDQIIEFEQQLLQNAPTTYAEKKLINIAADCDITVSSGQGSKGNMVDGDETTLWIQDGGFPGTIIFGMPVEHYMNTPIKKVVLKFEQNKPDWTVDVKLSHAVNNVTDLRIVDNQKTDQKFTEPYVYEFTELVTVSDFEIVLSNPKNNGSTGAFWPAIAEVEIWVEEKEEIDYKYENITPLAEVSTNAAKGQSGVNFLSDGIYGTNPSLYKMLGDGDWDGLAINSITPETPLYVDLSFKDNKKVKSIEVAFEKEGAAENYGIVYTYDILGKAKGETEFRTLVSQTTGDRRDKVAVEYNFEPLEEIETVRINFTKMSRTDGNQSIWPSMAELKIMATQQEVEGDGDNIAFKKPVFSNSNMENAHRAVNGVKTSGWTGGQYPAYIDIDLEKNYDITEIQIYTPITGYSQYSIFTSLDGKDYSEFATKTSKEKATADGESYFENATARFVRVYMEYNSTSSAAVLNEVRVIGTESSVPLVQIPDVTVPDFEGSVYDVEITEQDTVNELKGIVTRTVGAEYVDWFDFVIAPNAVNTAYDYFELSDSNGKIKITGNNGVSLATGLNHYYKYFCNVHISQVENQVEMPQNIVRIGNTPYRRETKYKIRYSYNYCTLSYSMAFWGEDEWRNELDWLALNGVNVILDLTGQEEVWRRFLTDLGYTHKEAKNFIAGPAYYAWAYMANLFGLGGPVHDTWFTERTELARKNQLVMRKLGMQPVLQAYSGMVPVDIKNKVPSAEVIVQPYWVGSKRPDMLKTDTQSFVDFAEKFYKHQKDVYGDVTNYYATDPFHEGGATGGMSTATIGRIVMEEMLKADPDGVWIIQAWGGNPSSGLLNGIAPYKENALVLDLYAEKSEEYSKRQEFQSTPWVYCMLNNFGGRVGLHGHIENFINRIPYAANNANWFRGIGITPEASVNNPVLYDLFFETIWTETPDNLQPINLTEWFAKYTERRYGEYSDSAYRAMLILNDTVYKPELNNLGQGAPESVINARPRSGRIGAASTWGNSVVSYDKEHLEQAAILLLKDYDKLKDSPAYLYDVADILKQVLSNTAQNVQEEMSAAKDAKDIERFNELSAKFLAIIDEVDKILSTQTSFLLGTWTENAKAMAANADDFTKKIYELNAKALITTWGGYPQAISGGLTDYSNRQWAGLTSDFYKARWEEWIGRSRQQITSTTAIPNITTDEWFEFEWAWARGRKEFTAQKSNLDLKQLGDNVVENFMLNKVVNADDSAAKDLPTSGMTATTGSAQPGVVGEGAAEYVLDGNTGTIWHTLWAGTEPRENHWLEIDLGGVKKIDGIRVLPRSGGGVNGIIKQYEIWVTTETSASAKVAEGTWTTTSEWKIASFNVIENATKVRLVVKDAVSDQTGKIFASAAEVRITSPEAVTGDKLTGTVAITGEQVIGNKLTAVVSGVNVNASSLKYQWYRNGEPIGIETSLNTYYVTSADIGKKITVKVISNLIDGEISSEPDSGLEATLRLTSGAVKLGTKRVFVQISTLFDNPGISNAKIKLEFDNNLMTPISYGIPRISEQQEDSISSSMDEPDFNISEANSITFNWRNPYDIANRKEFVWVQFVLNKNIEEVTQIPVSFIKEETQASNENGEKIKLNFIEYPITFSELDIASDDLENNGRIELGETVTLKAVANGIENPRYQWLLKGLPIGGATANTYTFTADNSGAFEYSYLVSGDNGVGVFGKSFFVNVSSEPVLAIITSSAQTIKLDETATLAAIATGGNGTYDYKWYLNDKTRNDYIIFDQTKPTLTLEPLKMPEPLLPGTYEFYCTANGIKSNVITLVVDNDSQPIALILPELRIGEVGEKVWLSVGTANIENPTYEWYSNTTSSTTGGTKIESATKNSYTFNAEQEGTYYFYCVVNGTIKSNVVTVEVFKGIAGLVAETNKETVEAGSEVIVNIKLQGKPPISGAKFKINFDKTKLTPVSYEGLGIFAEEGGKLTSNMDKGSGNNLDSLDFVSFVWANLENVALDNNNIVSIIFKTNSNISQSEMTALLFSDAQATDKDLNDLYVFSSLIKTIEIIPTNTIKYGDVNSDGIIDSADLVLLMQYLTNWSSAKLTENQLKAANVTHDDRVDTKDVVKILQYLANWDINLNE